MNLKTHYIVSYANKDAKKNCVDCKTINKSFCYYKCSNRTVNITQRHTVCCYDYKRTHRSNG